jgi:transposase
MEVKPVKITHSYSNIQFLIRLLLTCFCQPSSTTVERQQSRHHSGLVRAPRRHLVEHTRADQDGVQVSQTAQRGRTESSRLPARALCESYWTPRTLDYALVHHREAAAASHEDQHEVSERVSADIRESNTSLSSLLHLDSHRQSAC